MLKRIEYVNPRSSQFKSGEMAFPIENHKRVWMFERANLSVIGTLKGKPQERDQHEIRLADIGWMNALRACETLGRHHNPWDGNLREIRGYPISGKR
jgi:hypothetical protein